MRRVLQSGKMNSPDAELLERYVGENSDDAFSALVERHFGLVYSAAARQLAGDHDLARDVAQTVFADLARKARSLTNRSSLTGWLYTSTHFAAAKMVRTEQRRRNREQAAVAIQGANSDSEPTHHHLEPAVDRALLELDERDRDALLLRYFEQRELRTVGHALGISEEAARKRVERALEKVRAILARDGLVSTSASLSLAFSRQLTIPAPLGLAANIAELATSGMPLPSAAPAFLSTILMSKTKIVALGAVVLAAAITPMILQQRAIQRLRAESARAQGAAPLAGRDFAGIAPVNATESDSDVQRLRLEHSELLRLRAEVARLRQELADASAKRATPIPPAVIQAEADRPPEPVQTFVANADAVVPAGRSLVFGGWPTPPGKCTLVFVEPKILELASSDRVGSVLLEGKFIEIPDDALASLGLDKLKTGARATSVQTLLTAVEMKSILETLQRTSNVTILSAPRIQTGDGVQAVMSITENKMIAGQQHTLGPSLDVDPRIASDGSSVILTLSARLKKPSAAE
jgi:RNA polymerase sigma factor (sigma-70 family)